ncbi:SDR family NAD(P)-dependent oxidoreductase [Methylomonas methanica]|uniref:SDR family NAD(P)-dependent oxidoreductase n=1 Tax=Methylomonas methanica TaxID=421 RepID=UPI000ABC1C93|nr:SDR family NAD(P)-dependent oxidoreductase [Methylomonas methanica]
MIRTIRTNKGKVALITGGDSGIGRAVAVAFAKEGADSAVVYLNEHQDAEETKRLVSEDGQKCLVIAGDIGDEHFCREAVEKTVITLGSTIINTTSVTTYKGSPQLLDYEGSYRGIYPILVSRSS